MSFKLSPKVLNLKTNWKLSRNETLTKTNFILEYGGYESEVAPNIRFDEDQALIEKQFDELNAEPENFKDDWCQSFKNAVINLKLKKEFNGDLNQALNLAKVKEVSTSFSIPIMEVTEIKDYLYKNQNFDFYKVKINHANGIELISEISKYVNVPLRIDANEAFKSLDDYLNFEKELNAFNIQFIEQPFPASMMEVYKKLKPISIYEIIGDESIIDQFDEENFPKMFHGINVKLMKAGGLLKAKEILLKAKEHQLKTMIGCMIETSLGISEALSLASLCDYFDLDGALLISNDPYVNLLNIKNGKISS